MYLNVVVEVHLVKYVRAVPDVKVFSSNEMKWAYHILTDAKDSPVHRKL